MVKIWGYGDGEERPGGMLTTQKIGGSKAGKKDKVIMKLPSVYDIQRMVLARHMIYLKNPLVRAGMRMAPKEFEKNVQIHKKLHVELRACGPNGGILKRIRRKRIVSGNVGADKDDLQQRTWDMKALTYRSVVPEILGEMVQKQRKRTAQEVEDQERKDKEENLQRVQWLSRVRRDMKSDRVNEVLANHRMVALGGSVMVHQPIFTIYLESARYALKTHDWAVISKCLCGIIEKCRTTLYWRQGAQNIVWMLGLLTVTNHYKDDVGKVEEYAKNVHTLFGGLPLWIASHLAVWLIQKGYFMAAYRIVDEYSVERLSNHSMYRRPKYNKAENPKRDMAMFLTELIKGVYLYCVWKKESTMPPPPPEEEGQEEFQNVSSFYVNLRRKGEVALAAFETCFEKYKAIEGDAMCFLQPFMELVVEFRSVTRAREILEEVFNVNDGNKFVEEFYVEFLEEYFGHLEEEKELIKYLKRRTTRKFTVKEVGHREKYNGKRQINRLVEEKKKSGQEAASNWKQVTVPTFSW